MAGTGAPLPELTLRIHVRILAEPLHFTIDAMVDAANRVFAAAGIRVEVASEAMLDRPEMAIVDVRTPALDVEALFAERSAVPAGEVVVYFLSATYPEINGFAAHPRGRPGAVIAEYATMWTLAHELGHLLGLGHSSDTRRLMVGKGTSSLTSDLPALSPTEIGVMRASRLLRRAKV